MKFNPSKAVTILLWIAMIALLICLGSLAFAADAPTITKEQQELVTKIKNSKSAIEQAKYYKQLWDSLEKNPFPTDSKIKELIKQRNELDALLQEDLRKYSLSKTYLTIDGMFNYDSQESFLAKEIADLERVKTFIERIKASPKMKEAFLLAKKSGVGIELAYQFKVHEQGYLLINLQASDNKIIEFLLGPEN